MRILALIFLTIASIAQAGEISKLPVIEREPASADWLIDNSAYKAEVGRDAEGRRLVLDNGLVRREFLIAPNIGCVSYENLSNMAQCLRAVEPEAEVVLNGRTYAVGGLIGQRHKAYLLPEWLSELKSDSAAFQFTGFEIGQPKERLKWPRLRYCDPNAVWPPKGVALRFDFAPPSAEALAGINQDLSVRIQLLEDSLDKKRPGWRSHVSKAHERSSIDNEGKFGEIYTPVNTAAFLERDLPDGVEIVEVDIDPGVDTAASWGPGLALVFAKTTLKINVREYDKIPGTKSIGYFDGTKEHYPSEPRFKEGKTVRLRFSRVGAQWFASARVGDGEYRSVFKITLPETPRAVRIGKMDRSGGSSDYSTPGELARSRVNNFAAYGAIDKGKKIANPLAGVRVSVHYELYDGIPAMMKWITVHNGGSKPIELDRFTSEIVSAVERGEHTSLRTEIVPIPPPDDLHVETDYMFGSQQLEQASRDSVHWVPDPTYITQHQWRPTIPCQLRVEPTIGPDQIIAPGETFQSFHAFELFYDSKDRERRGLANRRLYRVLSPWVTEVPLIMHLVSSKEETVRQAIDQAAECGFEMVSLSFGSRFSFENTDPEYRAHWKKMVDYARDKGIELGAYSLLASRSVGGGNDVVPPPDSTGLPKQWFGRSPALASQWGVEYFQKLRSFFEEANFMQFTHDGSYPGDFDAKARPPFQRGLEDSQWAQWRAISDFYRFLLERGVYNRVPDYYFMSGANVCAMGYRENNWSLPRDDQVLLTRTCIYDNTWRRTPTMGWTFIPLTNYHGGGDAARIEPLAEHIDHYERMIQCNLALGVESVYRGARLYDTPAVRDMVIRNVQWYKKYRDILSSDLIHGRRADGRDIDWMLHVNPRLKHKGMLAVFNPLNETVERKIKVNLYYTGLSDTAMIRQREEPAQERQLGRDYSVTLSVTLAPRGFSWFVIE